MEFTEQFAFKSQTSLWPWITYVLIKLSSAKGCQGIRETQMPNDGRVLLAVRNLYVRKKFVWRHSTPVIPTLIARNQSLLQSRSFLMLKVPIHILLSENRELNGRAYLYPPIHFSL